MDSYLKMTKDQHAAAMQSLKIRAAKRKKRFKNETLRAQVLKELGA